MISRLVAELQLPRAGIEAVLRLLDEGATIPFIARYRKEATGSLDEVAIAAIRDRREALQELDKRRAAILESLAERELLTPELQQAVENAITLAALEDIYLPYRPKRRTRALMARERGLEPLAAWLRSGKGDPRKEAAAYVDAEKGVPDADAALAGARDIIAEELSENPDVRKKMRDVFAQKGRMVSTVVSGKEEEGARFRDYFNWDEPVNKAPSHRILAVLRGEEEGVLRLSLRPAEEDRLAAGLAASAASGNDAPAQEVRAACMDGYARLLAPAMETELRASLKTRADAEAIAVFAENLRQLLLAPPLGNKAILGVDPGFRTGCKLTCLSAEGKLLEYVTINPHAGSDKAREDAGRTVLSLLQRHPVNAVAVGNGTAGRETETFLRALPGWPAAVPIIMVSESGASVYSASEAARAEFPDLDLTYRGAVSIGRRLADPLAELVKIDPKSIGVGQYQHDVHQGELKRSLDDVVMSCVNAVGVDVNTASEQLLAYVSGLGPSLARNIVAFRHENGAFAARKTLRKVPRLGPKAFEQCSGFLRIPDAANPLDASAVHPESYPVVERMAADLGVTVQALVQDTALQKRIEPKRYVSDSLGLPTLADILKELEKPGRDPRPPYKMFSFAEGVSTLDDLRPGMKLPGIVTNVTAFGAFVDIGVHQDGLVHVSQLADRFVKNPAEVVRVQQEVAVTVLEVDKQRKRISLSMK